MKILLPILACCIIALAASSSPGHLITRPTAIPIEHLKGKVKSVTTYTYDSVKTGRQIDSGWIFKTTELYNVNGKMTASNLQSPKHPTSVMLYQYNGDGRETVVTDGTGKERHRSEYGTSASGNLVQKQLYGGKMMLMIVYNKNNQRDTTFNYDVIGKLTAKMFYHYDGNSNLSEVVTNRASRQNLVLTPTGLKTNDSGGYRDVYTYDRDHNELSETRYDADGKPQNGHRYTYDKYNNVVMQVDSNDFYIGGFAPYTNSKTGDLHTRSFSYPVIDQHGNWLQQDALLNGVAVKTMKRKIEYYP